MQIKNFISEETISQKIKSIAKEIRRNYRNDKVLLLGVLKGSFIFIADLARELAKLNVPVEVEFVDAKSYKGFTSDGEVVISKDLSFVKGKRVILVEDVYDTGSTISKLKDEILKNSPFSLELCVLLYKQKEREREIIIDYIGFIIPDKFVVGYGLDYNESFRELPYIGILENG